jgi:hypothetical protein
MVEVYPAKSPEVRKSFPADLLVPYDNTPRVRSGVLNIVKDIDKYKNW